MTYASEIAAGSRDIGFYIAIDGFATRIATHDMAQAPTSLSGTYLPVIVPGTLMGGRDTLDREKGVVEGGGFSVDLLIEGPSALDVLGIFRRKGGTQVELTQTLSKTATQVYMDDGGGLAGENVWVNREVITLGTWDGGNLRYNSCTRAVNGTVARPHLASSVASTVPRHWEGTRVELYGVIMDTGSTQKLGAYTMAESPRFTSGTLSLSFVSLISVLSRPIFSGFRDQTATAVVESSLIGAPTWANEVLKFDVEDARNFASNATYGAVKITVGDLWGVFYILGTNAISFGAAGLPDTLTVSLAARFAGNLGFDDVLNSDDQAVLRQCAIVTLRPGQMALAWMLSDEGDGVEHSAYDILPGRGVDFAATTDDMEKKRAGIGLPSAWVDIDAFQNIPVAAKMTVFVDEEKSFIEFFADEIGWRLGGYIYAAPNGKISFQEFKSETVRGAALSVNTAHYLPGDVEGADDEDTIVSRAEFKCNFHIQRGFQKTIVSVFRDTAEDLSESHRELKFEARSVVVGGGAATDQWVVGSTTTQEAIAARLERLNNRAALGARRWPRRFPWQFSEQLRVGMRVSFTDPRMPDFEGGLGIADLPMEVVEYEPDFDQLDFVVVLEEVPAGVRWAPSGVVASYAANVITFTTTGPHGAGRLYDSSVAELFPDDCRVRIYDASATPPRSTSEIATVLSSSGATLTLTAAPTTTPAAEDLVVLVVDDPDTGNPNSSGADVQDYAGGANASGKVGTGGNERDAPRLG